MCKVPLHSSQIASLQRVRPLSRTWKLVLLWPSARIACDEAITIHGPISQMHHDLWHSRLRGCKAITLSPCLSGAVLISQSAAIQRVSAESVQRCWTCLRCRTATYATPCHRTLVLSLHLSMPIDAPQEHQQTCRRSSSLAITAPQ